MRSASPNASDPTSSRPYILAGFPDLMESLDDVAGMKGMTAQGHLVEMKGADLNKCVAAGVSTCHEALSADDIMDRARVGVHAMLPRPYGVARRRRRHEGHDRSGSFGGDEGRGPEQVRGRRRVHLP